MWLKNLVFLTVLFIIVQSAQSHLLKRNATIVFRRSSTVQINGVTFSELNCTFPMKILCDNVTEITCSTQHGKLVTNSCFLSGNATQNSSLYNRTAVTNETVICSGKRLLVGECYLKFSLKSLRNAATFQIKKDDPFLRTTGRDFEMDRDDMGKQLKSTSGAFQIKKDPFDDPFFHKHDRDFENDRKNSGKLN